LLGLSTEETAECYCCKKEYRISKFQKLLADGRIKVLTTCQSYGSGNNQCHKQHHKVDINHRNTDPNIEILTMILIVQILVSIWQPLNRCRVPSLAFLRHFNLNINIFDPYFLARWILNVLIAVHYIG
jgi:hypothetical protein